MKIWLRIVLLSGLLLAGVAPLIAELDPESILKYQDIHMDFLRAHYTEIDNGRMIRVETNYQTLKWLSPFEYKEQLNLIGFNVNNYHILRFTVKENDALDNNFRYVFPLLLFPTRSGDLQEFQDLVEGDRIAIYGRFYNLKKSEFAIAVDAIETIRKGGHDRNVLIDTRVPPTPTPAMTFTPTPGPGPWQRLKAWMNPAPTGTVTPEAK